jgi:hypothetical protein
MRALVIKDGVVINAIEVDSLDSFPDLIDGETGNIGDTWDGTTLTPRVVVLEPLPHDPSYVPPDPKPPTVEEQLRAGA